MKLNIPVSGDILILVEDWTFPLYNCHRNTKMTGFHEDVTDYFTSLEKDLADRKEEWHEALRIAGCQSSNIDATKNANDAFQIYLIAKREFEEAKHDITIPKGTWLKFGKIINDSGIQGYDIVTLTVVSAGDKKYNKRKVSFCALLEDVNKMDIEVSNNG